MPRLDWDAARRREQSGGRPDRRDPAGHLRKPSPKQLRYLRDLAMQTGTTFKQPSTTIEASGEIARLKKLPRKHRK